MRDPHYSLQEEPFPGEHWMVIDVRSPAEFARGHLPGAVNIPLFSNEERAVVGTLYKQVGRTEALEKGLAFVGPKMEGFVAQVRKERKGRPLLIYCWRGGMRSNSFGWLMRTAGFPTAVVPGGYKAWRKEVHAILHSPFSFYMLAGHTGSGKTEVLSALGRLGHQVICLESLAKHRGSAFGAIGQGEQPTTESFENELAQALFALNPTLPIWLEDESISIGKVFIPQAFFTRMQQAPTCFLRVPFENRLQRLVDMYGSLPKDELAEAFSKLQKRMGGQHVKAALAFLEAGNLKEAARIALEYYDKAYAHSFSRKETKNTTTLEARGETPMEWAQQLNEWTWKTSN